MERLLGPRLTARSLSRSAVTHVKLRCIIPSASGPHAGRPDWPWRPRGRMNGWLDHNWTQITPPEARRMAPWRIAFRYRGAMHNAPARPFDNVSAEVFC